MSLKRTAPLKKVLGLILVVIVGSTIAYLYGIGTNQPQTVPTQTSVKPGQPQPTIRPVSTPAFDIQKFYDKIQAGMTPEEVIALAGRQPDDCASTDSIPPSVACFWNSGTKTVSVSYGNKNAVGAKNKTGF